MNCDLICVEIIVCKKTRTVSKIYFPLTCLRYITPDGEYTKLGVEVVAGELEEYSMEGDCDEIAQIIERAIPGVSIHNIV